MITITNQKVAGFAPRWASFRGFSLLFDNPGNSLARSGERLDLTCNVDADADLGFYKALRDGLDQLGLELLTNTYLFCPLPPSSYHVTAWDGGNEGNLTMLLPSRRPELDELLAGLPGSLSRPNALTEMAAASPLVANPDWGLRFRFDRLAQWGNSVLVAYLSPADEPSADTLQRLAAERSRLTAAFREAFGIGPSKPFRPHVSLGYFANRELAQLATPCVDAWHRLMEERMRSLILPLRRIGLYGFLDMATFFKPAPPVGL